MKTPPVFLSLSPRFRGYTRRLDLTDLSPPPLVRQVQELLTAFDFDDLNLGLASTGLNYFQTEMYPGRCVPGQKRRLLAEEDPEPKSKNKNGVAPADDGYPDVQPFMDPADGTPWNERTTGGDVGAPGDHHAYGTEETTCCTFRVGEKCPFPNFVKTFYGLIDEVTVWNRALENDEVRKTRGGRSRVTHRPDRAFKGANVSSSESLGSGFGANGLETTRSGLFREAPKNAYRALLLVRNKAKGEVKERRTVEERSSVAPERDAAARTATRLNPINLRRSNSRVFRPLLFAGHNGNDARGFGGVRSACDKQLCVGREHVSRTFVARIEQQRVGCVWCG
eukprot:1181274-Prorocentrum_minimum.AAC.1